MTYHEDSARIKDLEGLLHAAQVKAEETEGRIAELFSEIAVRDKMIDSMDGALELMAENVKEANSRWMEAEAQCAAMREALEEAMRKPSWEFQHVAKADVSVILDNTDAGSALLERLAKADEAYENESWHSRNLGDELTKQQLRADKAEAERVEAYVPKSFCRNQCACWKTELEGCGEWKRDHCEVRFFHDYLRDNNMIREAE